MRNIEWSDKENELVRVLYPYMSSEDILYILGTLGFSRTIDALSHKKKQLKLTHLCRSFEAAAKNVGGANLPQETKRGVLRTLDELNSATVSGPADSVALKKKLREIELSSQHNKIYEDFIASVISSETSLPDWTTRAVSSKGKEYGIPCVLISDIHGDEIVEERQIEGMNKYDRKIATKRLRRTMEGMIKMLRRYTAGLEIQGVTVAMAGDMISGIIHEELRETNNSSVLDSVLYWSETCAAFVHGISEEFGKVYVPCVVGNHGRLDRKPRMKGGVRDNLDWLLYQMMKRQLSSEGQITVDVSESFDIRFPVFNTTYLMHHGEQFKGGSGISGALSPWLIGEARKRARAASIQKSYDYMIMGHWHQLSNFRRIIVNGSIKGYDEFAYKSNYEFELPQQALWITTPARGITVRMPIFCE